MSQDQRPRRPLGVTPPTRRQARAAADTSNKAAPEGSRPAPELSVGKPPVYMFVGLFLVACTGAGAGVALLPWLFR